MMPRKETLAEGIEIWLGDCREILPTLGRFDAVVTDPPYGLGEGNTKKHMSRGKLAAPRLYDVANDWDDQPADAETIALCRERSDWQVIFGGNYFDLPSARCWLIWDKLNGNNDFADCEMAWTNLPKAVRRISWLWNGMLRAESGPREHSTQKPREVMKWCIGHLPSDALEICDPFMGSGTTGVACVNLGRKFTGIEIEPKYFDIARRRISDALKQPDMFIEKPKPAHQEAMAL